MTGLTGAQRLSPISVEDYLQDEQRSRMKPESVAGMVYAKAGGRYAYNLIATYEDVSFVAESSITEPI